MRSNPTTEKRWESHGAEGQHRLGESFFPKRLGRPEDTARAVPCFACDLAAGVSGQVLSVGGGRS